MKIPTGIHILIKFETGKEYFILSESSGAQISADIQVTFAEHVIYN